MSEKRMPILIKILLIGSGIGCTIFGCSLPVDVPLLFIVFPSATFYTWWLYRK